MGNNKILNKGLQPDTEKSIEKNIHIRNNEIIKIINSLWQKVRPGRSFLQDLNRHIVTIISILIFLFITIFLFYFVPALQEIASVEKTDITNDKEFKKEVSYKTQISQITRDIQHLSRKYKAYTSGQSYIVINTSDNRFFLFRNKRILREGFCSSGSYTLLQTQEDKQWIFKTPKGKYRIQGKTTNPVWKKPDWAFVEEGLPIPPKDDYTRFEYGVLGDYALSIGDGYLIHGTIYKRFLGMPVTHGCVRLNDEDLEIIFKTLSIGSKVYIF
ncbi:MAG TPA: L,D-transpeptidase [Bacteroidales bacterium]|nr:L,D-transpeptidase [Bacteroidales bacterium]